mgnify:CR=1 FL=1
MNEIDLLSHVYQTAEMGQDGITSVLKRSRDPSLNQALERQKREYHDLQASAGDMLRARGIQPDGVGAVAKLSSGMMSAMKTMMDHSSTKIAEMMIQGTVMGITSLKTSLSELPKDDDEEITALLKDLIALEEEFEKKLKTFL